METSVFCRMTLVVRGSGGGALVVLLPHYFLLPVANVVHTLTTVGHVYLFSHRGTADDDRLK